MAKKAEKSKALTAEFCASQNFDPMSERDLNRIKPPKDIETWANATRPVFLTLHVGWELMGMTREDMIAKFEADPDAACDFLETLRETGDFLKARADCLDRCWARFMVAASVVELKLNEVVQ